MVVRLGSGISPATRALRRQKSQSRCNPTGYLFVSTFRSHSAPAPAPRLGPPSGSGAGAPFALHFRARDRAISWRASGGSDHVWGTGVTLVPILR
jgi:hypothetical protein